MTTINESRNALRFTSGPSAGRGKPTEIVIHHWGVDGQSHDGILNWFCDNQSVQTSAHFVVSGGRIDCIVNLTDVAWHAGDWAANVRSVGIECRPEATAADYATVAELVAWLRTQYGDIPLRPHKQYASTSCPGRYDLARLDREARAYAVKAQGGSVKPIAPKPAVKPVAKPAVQTGLVNRYVTNDNAYLLTRPTTAAPTYAVFPKGTPLAIKGYVGGQDPYGTGDTAWYVTGSGHYVWANAAEDNVAGLRFLGNM